MAERITIIEDDESIRELVRVTLEAFGYEVLAYESAEEALAAIREQTPDLAVFDVMLPGMDGVTAVRQLRTDPKYVTLPVLMLTAKGSETDKVIGLDAGADDYLTKPFGVLELAARIRSLLRRAKQPTQERAPVLSASGITMNIEAREVRQDGQPIELTHKEFELLRLLMENSVRVMARDELLNEVWGYSYIGETRTLDMHIRSLRAKLGDDADNPKYIRTIRSVGYRFVE